MALTLNLSKGSIDVVISKDPAVGCDEEGYKAYVESFRKGQGDESLLKMTDEPTRFTLKKMIPYDAALEVKDRQMGFEDGKPRVRLSFMVEEIRYALVGIKNPPNVLPEAAIEFKRDSDNFASKELVQLMEQAGWINDLYAARKMATSSDVEGIKKK